MTVAIIAAATMIMTGCGKHNVELFSAIDKNEQTVLVPIGSKGLKGPLKKTLIAHGWSLVVDRGPEITEGVGDPNNIYKTKTYDNMGARYRLAVGQTWRDACLNGEDYWLYEISFIDNRNGVEVFTMDGQACEQDIIKTFNMALRGEDEPKQKTYSSNSHVDGSYSHDRKNPMNN